MSNSIILLAFFLGLDLLLAAVRAALVHARLPQLMKLRQQHPVAVDRTIRSLDEPRLRVSLRLAAVLIHFILAGLALILVLELFPQASSIGWMLLVLFAAGLILVIFEFAIEGAILHQPEEWALRFLGVGQLLDFILRPASATMMRLLGSSVVLMRQLDSVTDDELKNWVEVGQPDSSLEKGERKMIASIFEFGDTICREIMVPRIDVFGLEVSTSLPEAIEAFTRSGHSRIPVYDETIDDILGILYAKDLLRARLNPTTPDLIRKLVRPPYYVPESKKVDALLREMQLRGVHMAIVVDEYGGTSGIITLEDIVEEIVGEIRDEYDQSEEQLYHEVSPDELTLVGRIDLDDVNELLGTHLAKDGADTLGGYIYSQIGRVPTGGEALEVEDWILTVEQVNGRRIRTVRAHRKPAQESVEEKNDGDEQRDTPKTD
jgi:putative hemolysin